MQDANQVNHDEADVHEMQLAKNVKTLLQSGQHTLIRRILRVIAFLGIFAVISAILDVISTGQYIRLFVIGGIYLVLLIVAIAPGVTFSVQAGVFVFMLFIIGVFNLVISGHAGNGIPFLLAASTLTPLLFGRRIGIIVTVLTVVTVILIAFLFINGNLFAPQAALPKLDDANGWIIGVVVYIIVGAILTIPQEHILQRFTSLLSEELQLSKELETERVNLEERVAERTEIITRRAKYLSASSEVASEAARVIEYSDELLSRVVNLISEKFGFYHTGLFLNDSAGKWTELKAASSEGGQKMLARSHRLLIGSQGIVGYVALRGEPRIALDVGTDAVFFDNPDLPGTRSEIALPLIVRDEVIGVLDVQSTESQAFIDEDVAVLQLLADQVAMAISNARLFALAQESIEAERRLRGDLVRQGWRDLLLSEQNLIARSTAMGESTTDELWTPEVKAAIQQAEPVIDEDTQKRIAIPIKVAGQTIGFVSARKSPGPESKPWLVDEVRLLTTLTDQLNTAVERVRLYRQAQLFAARQRTLTEAGARMRASLQLETMLQTAATEIRQALDLGDVEIRLASPKGVSNQVDGTLDGNGAGV
jgi:GAF domain-containing protein